MAYRKLSALLRSEQFAIRGSGLVDAGLVVEEWADEAERLEAFEARYENGGELLERLNEALGGDFDDCDVVEEVLRYRGHVHRCMDELEDKERGWSVDGEDDLVERVADVADCFRRTLSAIGCDYGDPLLDNLEQIASFRAWTCYLEQFENCTDFGDLLREVEHRYRDAETLGRDIDDIIQALGLKDAAPVEDIVVAIRKLREAAA